MSWVHLKYGVLSGKLEFCSLLYMLTSLSEGCSVNMRICKHNFNLCNHTCSLQSQLQFYKVYRCSNVHRSVMIALIQSETVFRMTERFTYRFGCKMGNLDWILSSGSFALMDPEVYKIYKLEKLIYKRWTEFCPLLHEIQHVMCCFVLFRWLDWHLLQVEFQFCTGSWSQQLIEWLVLEIATDLGTSNRYSDRYSDRSWQ